MNKNVDEMIEFLDKVIYYKRKMESSGQRYPDYPRVYINKLFVGLSDSEPNLSYRNTKFY